MNLNDKTNSNQFNTTYWKNSSFNKYLFGNGNQSDSNDADDVISKIQSTFKKNSFKENYKNIEEFQNIYEKIQEPLKLKAPKSKAKPLKIKPVKTKPLKIKPVKTKPLKIKPVKTKPLKIKPLKIKPVKSKKKSKNKNKNSKKPTHNTNFFSTLSFSDLYKDITTFGNKITYSIATFIINLVHFNNIYDTKDNKYNPKLESDRKIIMNVLSSTFFGIIFTIPIIIIFTTNLLHIWLGIIKSHDPCMLNVITKIPNWKIGMFLQYPIYIVSLFLRILLIYPKYASPSYLSIIIFIISVILMFNPISAMYNLLLFVSGVGTVIIVALFVCMFIGINDLKSRIKSKFISDIISDVFIENSSYLDNSNFNNSCSTTDDPPEPTNSENITPNATSDVSVGETTQTNNEPISDTATTPQSNKYYNSQINNKLNATLPNIPDINNNNINKLFQNMNVDNLLKKMNIDKIVKNLSGAFKIPNMKSIQTMDKPIANMLIYLPIYGSMKIVFYILSFILTISTSFLISPLLLLSVAFYSFPTLHNPFTFLYGYFSEMLLKFNFNPTFIEETRNEIFNKKDTNMLDFFKIFLRVNKSNLLAFILLLKLLLFNIVNLNTLSLLITFIILFCCFIIWQLVLLYTGYVNYKGVLELIDFYKISDIINNITDINIYINVFNALSILPTSSITREKNKITREYVLKLIEPLITLNK